MVDPTWLAAERTRNQQAVGLAGLGYGEDLQATMRVRNAATAAKIMREREARAAAIAAAQPPRFRAEDYVLAAPAASPMPKYMMIAAVVLAAIGLAAAIKRKRR